MGFGDADGICLPGIFISIFGEAPGDGLGICIGIFISIFCCGDACAFGEADGICMPGMFICIGGDGCGLGVGVFCGELVLGIFMPGMLLIVCFFVVCRLLLVGLRRVLLLFCFAFALGLDMLMPGMFCMSWPRVLARFVNERIKPVPMTAQSPAILVKAPNPNFFIVPPVELLLRTKRRERVHKGTRPRKNQRRFLEEPKF